MIKASIKVLGKTYTAEGKTIQEAIGNLKPGTAKGMSILTIKNGDKTQDRVLPHIMTQRLFSPSPTTRIVNIKQISMRFGI
ncbi:hypothetical protein LCGC14_1793030 [marine sediment metagenome]|uniref:Uncharacterized protein n=1 Tax=marine sediment metagenome TaxID=412755 RepID=A0A0F9GRY9_9ZZZZ